MEFFAQILNPFEHIYVGEQIKETSLWRLNAKNVRANFFFFLIILLNRIYY